MLTKIIWTDEHRSYPKAFELKGEFEGLIEHIRISSKLKRTISNPLFPVNYMDRLFRKDLSDHVRETVKFARHPSCMMSRLMVYRFYHNCLKPYRLRHHKENREDPIISHAEEAGMNKERLDYLLKSNMGKRFFLNRNSLNEEERSSWLQKWNNPGVESDRYIPKYLWV